MCIMITHRLTLAPPHTSAADTSFCCARRSKNGFRRVPGGPPPPHDPKTPRGPVTIRARIKKQNLSPSVHTSALHARTVFYYNDKVPPEPCRRTRAMYTHTRIYIRIRGRFGGEWKGLCEQQEVRGVSKSELWNYRTVRKKYIVNAYECNDN